MVSLGGKTKSGKKITVFNGEGIIVSLDGSSGSMTYKKGQKFALNHHAGFFKIKKNAVKLIIPEFFVLFYGSQLKAKSISEGSNTLTLDQIYSMDFDIPSFEIQKKVMLLIGPLIEKDHIISQIMNRTNNLKDRVLSYQYSKLQTSKEPIRHVIGYMSGNSGLTDQFIYQTLQRKGKRYTVLSSSTEENTKMGEVPMVELNRKPLKVFENKEGLLVVRNGKAGATMYLPKGDYTINDHAYILSVKNDCPYKINLKWLSIQYKEDFLFYSSSSDNGTWNMTGFFQDVVVDIPDYAEQMEIVEEYEKLERYETRIKEIIEKIHKLTLKSFAQS